MGLIIGSTQRLACQFKANSGWTQNYIGRINRIGLDIGITAGGVMAWAVLGSFRRDTAWGAHGPLCRRQR